MSEKDVKAVALDDALLDFILSRQAMLCTKETIRWYKINLTQFLDSLKQQGLEYVSQLKPINIREHLTSLSERGLSDSYTHGRARTIRTFVHFLHSEGYITNSITVTMPRMAKKPIKALTADQVKELLNVCHTVRDKAIISFMVDTGLRRAEVVALNWQDVNLQTGAVVVRQGKGKKARIAVMGYTTRRLLLTYKRTQPQPPHCETSLFQTEQGTRLTANGLRSVLLRISRKANIEFSPHTLRRTFATLSLRAGMSPLHLQALLGHSTLEMVMVYVQMLDTDLLDAHSSHGPIDNLK